MQVSAETGAAVQHGQAAIVAGVATFVAYMIGSTRAYGYDAAVTVDQFVTEGWSTPFTEQTVYNNHPLFSFVEHAVWRVTGSSSEVVLRVAPCLFAALAVGLVVSHLAKRWGMAAGVAAGVALAVNPLLVPLVRDVRGYSLAVFALVVAGIALDEDRPALFAVAAFVAVGTHLHSAVPVGLVVLWLIGSGRFSPRWRVPLYAAGLATVLVYVGMLDEMGGDHGFEWQARFLFWTAPISATAAGWLVAQDRRWLAPLTVAAVTVAAPMVPRWTQPELPNRELASRAGTDVCAVAWSAEALTYYLPELRPGEDCAQVALLDPDATPSETAEARAVWPAECWRSDRAELRAINSDAC